MYSIILPNDVKTASFMLAARIWCLNMLWTFLQPYYSTESTYGQATYFKVRKEEATL